MSTSYTLNRDQIIVSALRKIGIIEPSDTTASIDSNIIANAVVTLNTMVKQWATEGIKLWTVVELTLPLVATKTTYLLGPSLDLDTDKPLKLIQAWIRNTSVTPHIDIPMNVISKQEYNILGSKQSTGTSNSIFMDPGLTSSTLYVYLTPDTLAASTYEMHLVVQRPIKDITSSTDTPDFPNEWLNALVWGLADELSIEFDVPLNIRQEIAMRAERYRTQLVDWDTEYNSTFFQPDYRSHIYKR